MSELIASSFPLSQKYIDFINSVRGVSADFLEGTTASGKTTVGAGVDMATTQPINEALAMFGELVKEMEEAMS